MTAITPQPAAGLRGRDHGNSAAGEITAQPLTFVCEDGTQLLFRSVESFWRWKDAEHRSEAEAKEIARRA